MAPILRLFGASGIVRRRVANSLRERSANGRWVTREVVDVYSRSLIKDTQRSLALLRSLAEAHEPTPIDEQARAIRVPVVLLVGDAKQSSGPGEAEITRMRETLTSFRVETIPNAGHFLQEEQPAAVAERILSIDRESARTPG